MIHPTVARLTVRGLLGRRRAALLFALPALLLVIAVAVRLLADQEDTAGTDVLSGFAIATMVPLIGVIAGTGAISPEIDDGSVVYLLSKPVPRPRIILTKLLVAVVVTMAFAAIPTFAAGLILYGADRGIAVAYGTAALTSSVVYGALFLLLGVATRHAVTVGLIYALVWEGALGALVDGAKALSVQQWSLSLAEEIADPGVVDAAVGLPAACVLLVVVTAAATWAAGQRLRSLTLAGDD
ncbi:ABC transporter permease [Streptomyces capparidis]